LRILILLIGLLAALVAGAVAVLPRLVDAEVVRGHVLAEMQQRTGLPIAVGGRAELVLLPRPVLSLGRVSIGSAPADGAASSVEIDRVDLELAPLPLLVGRPAIEAARLVRPRARLRPGDDRPIPLLDALGGEARPLQRLRIVDGQLAIERAGLPQETIERVELELQRRDDGALEATGIGRWRQQPWAGELHVAEARATRSLPLDLQLTLGSSGHASSLTLQGDLSLGSDDPLGAGFSGQVRIEADELAELAWAALAAAGRASDSVGRLRLGPSTLGGRLVGAGRRWQLDLSGLAVAGGNVAGRIAVDAAAPHVEVDLQASRLSPSDDLIEATRALIGETPAPPGLTGDVRLSSAELGWRGLSLRELRLEATLPGDDSMRVERLAARLPDEGQLSLEGVLSRLSGEPSWQGRASLSAQDVGGLLNGLGLSLPVSAPDRLRNLDGRAELLWSGRQVTLRDLDLRLDTTRITGSGALALERRPQLAAVLTLDRLPLDGYLPGATPRRLADLLARAAAELDMALDLDVGVLSQGDLRAERVRLRGETDGQTVTLHQLSVGDVAEASGSMVGTGDLGTGRMELALEAQIARPSRLARAVGFELPPLLGRLPPVRLSGTARSLGEGVAIELDAAAPGMTFDVDARLPPGLETAPRLERLELRADSSAELARQLGLPGAASAPQGEAAIEIAARPAAGGAVDLAVDARIDRSRATARLRAESAPARPRLSGSIDLAAVDPALLGLLWDAGEVALGFPPGPPSRWPGAWPRQMLRWGWLYAADLDLAIAGLVGGSARLDAGSLRLAIESAPLAGGRLSGRVELDGSGGIPALSADLALAGADGDEASGLIGLDDSLRGRLDLQATVTSAGASPAELAAALAGHGRLRLSDGAIEGIRLGPADIADPGHRSLPIMALDGPLTVDRGMVIGDRLTLAMPQGRAGLSLRLDLPAWILDTAITGPSDDTSLRLLGPPGRTRAIETPPAP
jgi:hypothetical protein